MQLSFFETLQDVNYSDKNVMIGLSGGINSAAALIYLAELVEDKPSNLFLYYSHLEEHSTDTKKFVLELVEYAKGKFENVVFEYSDNSILTFFENEFKGIPQPKITPCTRVLKINLMLDFMSRHKIDIDIVGYVRHEWTRIKRQIDRKVEKKEYLIRHLSDEDCFSIVLKYFGWFPEIYSLKWTDDRIRKAIIENGHLLNENQRAIIADYSSKGFNWRRNSYRVFKHNNCLPCKNMHQWELFLVRIFFPSYMKKADDLATKLGSYWGRSVEIVDEDTDCAICSI